MTNEQKEKLKIMIGDRLVSSLKQMQREGAATSYAKGVIAGAEWMEQNMWVPTSERLPEENGLYEVTCQVRGINTPPFTDRMPYRTGKGWLSSYANVNVTAWKPLTAPYSSPKPQTNAGTE